METAGIRELKNRLSHYIRLVKKGERVEVTDRGEVVAILGPPIEPELEGVPPGLAEMVRAGKVRLGAPNRPELYRDTGIRSPDGTAQRLLDETRGDR